MLWNMIENVSWSTTATQTVTLVNGINKIRVTSTTSLGCANLDYLQVTGSGTLKSINNIPIPIEP